jgi:hypothetical protein
MDYPKINVMDTIKDGFQLAIKNVLALLLLVILYVITVWIPYLNVGTTVGLYKAVIAMSRGEVVDPMSIFDKENFKFFGNFFLLMGLLSMGITAATAFMFVPGIILSIAWSLAFYLLIDKKVSPLKSLTTSYDVTLGEKWRIFFIDLLVGIIIGVVCGLFTLIPKVGFVFVALTVIVGCAYAVAVEALMYRHFADKYEAMKEAGEL